LLFVTPSSDAALFFPFPSFVLAFFTSNPWNITDNNMTPALCTNYRDKSERKSRKDGDGGLETGIGGWTLGLGTTPPESRAKNGIL
jgi:hypothetical protein